MTKVLGKVSVESLFLMETFAHLPSTLVKLLIIMKVDD